ncbi:MerR family transcriptional regulator [Nocardiopsis coralliicola]
MGWSTRQLAELAGTSLRTVRHYHDIGLLEEPARRANGYKSYGVQHLSRVIRIRRLSDLGFSLSQIAEMGDADVHPAQEELRTLDAELAATIERLQQTRVELALAMRRNSATDLPDELGAAAAGADLSESARGLFVVWSRLMGPEGLATAAAILRNPPSSADRDFDRLPPGADEAARRDVVERMVPETRQLLDAHPELRDPRVVAPRGKPAAKAAVDTAIDDLFNPAQRDVLDRVIRAVADPGGP